MRSLLLNRSNLLLLATAVLVVLLPLWFAYGTVPSDLMGTDDRAVEMVHSLSPGYAPWYNFQWNEPLLSHQNLLFALQGALGASVLLFSVIALHRREQRSKSRNRG